MSSWWKTDYWVDPVDPKDGRLVFSSTENPTLNHKITPLMRENHPPTTLPAFGVKYLSHLKQTDARTPSKVNGQNLIGLQTFDRSGFPNPAPIHVVNIPFI